MMNSIKFDLHTHNQLCGHAIGTIEDYVNRPLIRAALYWNF